MKISFALIAIVILTSFVPAQKRVYLCTDPKSQIYHYDELCKELEKCTFQVKEEKEMKRKIKKEDLAKCARILCPKKKVKKQKNNTAR
jgi:aromatic ring-opening dioxygenase catalytic subunit (LigB family)